ncbi:MAG: polysaccharide deacetylase family protein [Victivallaceae bacterium]|jgi:peptidoglycan/xylan/chitin deacetylase (PgdA/CDA1 family)
MRLRGAGRLQKAWRKACGIISPGPVILLYHRVDDLTTDPQLLSVSPAHFEEQLALLKKSYNIMRLEDMVTSVLKGNVPKRAVAITFDEGYADNYKYAWPLLKKYSMPATIYVTTGYVSANREFFCDELERLILRPDNLPEVLNLEIAGKHYEWRFAAPCKNNVSRHKDSWNVLAADNPSPAHQAYRELHRILHSQPYREQERALEKIRSAIGDDGSARQTHLAMSWEQIREIAADGLVDIGAHTVTHAFLSSLSKNEQQSEIAGSIQAIESCTKKRVTSFAYPYGTRCSYDTNTLAILKATGIANAASNFRSRISSDTDPFQLPRLVVRNCPGNVFKQFLKKNAL